MTMRKMALFLLMIMVWAGCSNSEQLSEEPHLEGLIYSLGDNSVLIVEGIDSAELPQEEWYGKRAISFRIKESTKIYDQNGEELSFNELEKGQTVAAWHTGIVRESYPEQADAVLIIVY